MGGKCGLVLDGLPELGKIGAGIGKSYEGSKPLQGYASARKVEVLILFLKSVLSKSIGSW